MSIVFAEGVLERLRELNDLELGCLAFRGKLDNLHGLSLTDLSRGAVDWAMHGAGDHAWRARRGAVLRRSLALPSPNVDAATAKMQAEVKEAHRVNLLELRGMLPHYEAADSAQVLRGAIVLITGLQRDIEAALERENILAADFKRTQSRLEDNEWERKYWRRAAATVLIAAHPPAFKEPFLEAVENGRDILLRAELMKHIKWGLEGPLDTLRNEHDAAVKRAEAAEATSEEYRAALNKETARRLQAEAKAVNVGSEQVKSIEALREQVRSTESNTVAALKRAEIAETKLREVRAALDAPAPTVKIGEVRSGVACTHPDEPCMAVEHDNGMVHWCTLDGAGCGQMLTTNWLSCQRLDVSHSERQRINAALRNAPENVCAALQKTSPKAPSKLQIGASVPWNEAEDGCLYYRKEMPCPFGMVVNGRAGVMIDPNDRDVERMLLGSDGMWMVARSIKDPERIVLIARDLGTDPEQWRQAMRDYLAKAGK